MNPRVKEVEAGQDYTLLVTFSNGEKKRFDVKPYLNIRVFNELKDPEVFHSVKPFLGSIQ